MLGSLSILGITPSEFWAMSPAEYWMRARTYVRLNTGTPVPADDGNMSPDEWKNFLETYGEHQD